jgi:hypothetical protein
VDKQELERLQQQMYDEMIEQPTVLDEQINDLAEHLGKQLTFKQKEKVKFEFLDHVYTVMYRKDIINFKEVILMIIIDESEINPQTNLPRTYNVNAEIDNNLSMSECLRATVASFLRHQTGSLKAELMEE